jgi:hypothetical protein
MKSDNISWLDIDSSAVQILEIISRTPSIVQTYALAARALRGDTVYHLHPAIDDGISARYAGKQNDERQKSVSSINIFPNPAKNSLTVFISENQEETLTEIIDIYGRVVLTKQLGNAELHMLDISSISTGWYLVRITRPLSGSFVQSVFIER